MFFLGNIGFWVLLISMAESNAFTSQPTLQGCWREVRSLCSSREPTWEFTAQQVVWSSSDTAIGANYEFNPRRKTIEFFAEKNKNGLITYKVLLLTKRLLVIKYHNMHAPAMQIWGDWVLEDEEKDELVVLLRLRRLTQ